MLQTATRESWSSCAGWRGLTLSDCCLIHSSNPWSWDLLTSRSFLRDNHATFRGKPDFFFFFPSFPCFRAPTVGYASVLLLSRQCHFAFLHPAQSGVSLKFKKKKKECMGEMCLSHMLCRLPSCLVLYFVVWSYYTPIWFHYIIIQMCNGLCCVVHCLEKSCTLFDAEMCFVLFQRKLKGI